jgi:hypothetical protein
MYAKQIKQNEPIDIVKFSQFLDSIPNPLTRAYYFDDRHHKYTINEYAILHGYSLHGFDIHAIFRNHTVDLDHAAEYPGFNIPEPLNILEAYIYHAKYLENIRMIMIQVDREQKFGIYFRKLHISRGLPSLLYFVLEASNFVAGPLDPHIYYAIMNIYMHPTIYNGYLIQNNPQNILNLLSIAIQYNKESMLREICGKMQTAEMIYSYIFTKQIVSYLLLQNNSDLYKVVFELLQCIDSAKVLHYINKYAVDPNADASKILQKYENTCNHPNPKDCKRFFEILGLHILQDTLPPYIGDHARIIIRCHGTTLNNRVGQFEYPFRRLCYFVEKGEYLLETCHVSNRTENMICTGNYDSSLKCIDPVNGMIETEPMRFSFDAGFYKGVKHKYTGIYVCRNGSVERTDEPPILNDRHYLFPEIVDIVRTICDSRSIDYRDADVMMFACRAIAGDTNPARRQVHPKITASSK